MRFPPATRLDGRADTYVYGVASIGDGEHHIIARVDGRRPPEKGATVEFAPKAGHVHLFSTETGVRLAT